MTSRPGACVADAPTEPGSEPLRNVRHEMFCQTYTGGAKRNGALAARMCGYSERTSNTIASNLCARVDIRERIDYLTKQFWKAFHIGPEETAARIAMAARPDIRLLYNDDGSHKKPHELCDQAAAMVIACETELKFDDDGNAPAAVRKYRLRSADPSLRLLAQMHKITGPDVNVTVNTDLAGRMERARRRAKDGR
jgi:hypothetical protein